MNTLHKDLAWWKSSHSQADHDCVEVAIPPGACQMAVRDSKDKSPDAPMLIFTNEAWASFAAAAARGDFGNV